MNYTNNKKAELVAELHGSQKDPQVKNVLDLVQILIYEARIDNDTAKVDDFQLNQGEIRGLVRLKEHIMRGLPGGQKTT